MARFNYSPIIKTTQKLVDKFGYDAIINRKVSGVTTAFPVVIVMTEYKPSDKDGVLIEQTDRKVLLAARGLTFTPNPETDRLVENGNNLQIVTVTPTAPAGVPILYELQVRR